MHKAGVQPMQPSMQMPSSHPQELPSLQPTPLPAILGWMLSQTELNSKLLLLSSVYARIPTVLVLSLILLLFV